MSVLEMSSAELLLSFAITWGLGLAPAIIARYAWYKQPLPRNTANWVAGTTSVVFWLLFLFLNAAAGQERGSGAVWILVFFVNRWLMTRGPGDAVQVTGATEGWNVPASDAASPVQADPLRNEKRMSAGAIALFACGVAAGTIGTIVFMEIYTTENDTDIQASSDKPMIRSDGPPVSSDPQIYRGNAPLNRYDLVRQYNANPNRFHIASNNAGYKVIGKISKVSEFNSSLTNASGFYVPLIVDDNKYDEVIGGPSPSVSLFVKGIGLREAAALDAGQLIEVACPAVRIVAGDIVFDDCEQESRTP